MFPVINMTHVGLFD